MPKKLNLERVGTVVLVNKFVFYVYCSLLLSLEVWLHSTKHGKYYIILFPRQTNKKIVDHTSTLMFYTLKCGERTLNLVLLLSLNMFLQSMIVVIIHEPVIFAEFIFVLFLCFVLFLA